MNKRILSVLLVVALLVVGCAFAVQATLWAPTDTEKTYFNTIAETYPTMAEVQAKGTGYCPVCQVENIEWEELPTNGERLVLGTHYYVADHINTDTVYTVPTATTAQIAASTVCIHLNGKNITATNNNAIFTTGVRATLNLIGSGIVTGSNAAANAGATITSTCYVNFFGGTYKHAASTDNATYVHNKTNINANIYKGTTFTADQTGDTPVLGSNVFLRMGTINMYGGVIENGNHNDNIDGTTVGHDGMQLFGGNVQVGNATAAVTPVFNMYDGTIQNGQALKGGNVAVVAATGSTVNPTFNMYGGTITGGKADCGGADSHGGNVYVHAYANNSTFTMSGGTISNGKAGGENESDVNYGGNIYALSTNASYAAKILLSGGTISGGMADKGGNVAINSVKTQASIVNTTLSGGRKPGKLLADVSGVPQQMGGNLYVRQGLVVVKNSTLTGGNSRVGGNIALECPASVSTCTVQLQNSPVSSGVALRTGGNIYMLGDNALLELGRVDPKQDNALVTGGTVSGGTATFHETQGNGGNIHVAGGTLNLKKGTVTGGAASVGGGNIYVTGGTVNMTDGTISSGNGKNGGNVMIANANAVWNMSGGTVTGGTAANRGNSYFLSAGVLSLTGGTIEPGAEPDGSAQTYDGNSVYIGASAGTAKAELQLGGSIQINKGDYFGDILMNTYATGLVVKDGFEGDVHLSIFGPSLDENDEPTSPIIRPWSDYYGYIIGSEYVNDDAPDAVCKAESAYTGSLTLHTSATNSVGIFPVETEDSSVYALKTASVLGTTDEGDEAWYLTAEDAVAESDSIKLFVDDLTVSVPEEKTVAVNLNGKNATASGEGELLLCDIAAQKGKLTKTGNVQLVNNSHDSKLVKDANGTTYLTYTNEDGTYSSYKLQVKLKGVSLRPSACGVFFRGIWTTGLEAENVGGFGIVVSLANQPTEDFMNDETAMYVEYPVDDMDGEERTGVLVKNILNKDATNNSERGMMPIYAASFITVYNGETDITIIDKVVDENGDPMAFSLYSILNMMEDSDTVWGAHADALNAFYGQWADELGWTFDRLGQ